MEQITPYGLWWNRPLADPEILKVGRQHISPVIIYRKCTQWTIYAFCTGKGDLL